jgi:tetratricopeptide (TPR) repeat protein
VIKLASCLLCLALILAGAGCRGKRTESQTPQVASNLPTPPPTFKHSDEEILDEAIKGPRISPAEVASLSDRMLTEGSSTFNNEKTMARLDILLNKSLNGAPKESRHRLLRNLGIIHYHQKKYSLARQELQQANELYPRDARTHYYLARLAIQNGNIYQCQGLAKKAKGQFNLAANELEVARIIEPSNPLYRQDLKQVLQKERTFSPDRKK